MLQGVTLDRRQWLALRLTFVIFQTVVRLLSLNDAVKEKYEDMYSLHVLKHAGKRRTGTDFGITHSAHALNVNRRRNIAICNSFGQGSTLATKTGSHYGEN